MKKILLCIVVLALICSASDAWYHPYYATKPSVGTAVDLAHPQLYGILGWWLFWEGAGANIENLVDRSGNTDGVMTDFANPSTLISGWGGGKFGRALVYDHSNDYVSVPGISFVEPPFTVMLWVLPYRLSGSQQFRTMVSIGGLGNVNSNFEFGIASNGTESLRKIYFFVVNSSTFGSVLFHSDVIQQQQWLHLAATLDAENNLLVYENGILVSSTVLAVAPADGGHTLRFGRWSGTQSISDPWDGRLDDIRIYNRVLTRFAIVDIMVNGLAPVMPRQFDGQAGAGFGGSVIIISQ